MAYVTKLTLLVLLLCSTLQAMEDAEITAECLNTLHERHRTRLRAIEWAERIPDFARRTHTEIRNIMTSKHSFSNQYLLAQHYQHSQIQNQHHLFLCTLKFATQLTHILILGLLELL